MVNRNKTLKVAIELKNKLITQKLISMHLNKCKRKQFNTILIILNFSLLFISCNKTRDNTKQIPLTLRYDKPATEWMTSALPIGNGEFGGMFYGGVEQETIQFNEKTLWTGSQTKRGAYQNFGYVYLNFQDHQNYTDYHRDLSLDNAIGSVSYKVKDVTYYREYFASNPDSMIVIRLSTPRNKGKLSFSVRMEDSHDGETIVDRNGICIRGKLDLVSYEAQIKVVNNGGELFIEKNNLVVKNADEVTIFLTGKTNYDIGSDKYIRPSVEQVHKELSERLSEISKKNYKTIKTTHINDYHSYFKRVKFDLKTPNPGITTDRLIKENKESNYLDMLYFQYGRYLMIASSRGMNLPNNLQGIWNNNNNPPWQCDIHTNINIQMNYWPAECTNLSECHLPFINYVKTEALKENGSFRQVAIKEKLRGWTLHTQSNIFGYTDWNINRPVNAWYCLHLWQHYLYTNDLSYLNETAFPVMKSACEYWFDRLIKDEKGQLIAPNEWSPEHGNWENNIAYAQQLIWELFNNTILACKDLKIKGLFYDELNKKFSNLNNGLRIGEWGQIKEWEYDTQNLDTLGNTHRHLSQLIALYPGNQISYLKNKRYAEGAKKSLESRGDEGTGWSRAWKIACWARLFDGNHAYRLLKQALALSNIQQISMDVSDGGVYENLLDAHPPFQIDGNFGATAGISEMLVQSHNKEIHLLPALPDAWVNGSIQGIKAVGNFEVSEKWKNGMLDEATIISYSGNLCTLRTSIPIQIMGVPTINQEDGNYYLNSIKTEKGKIYNIKPLK